MSRPSAEILVIGAGVMGQRHIERIRAHPTARLAGIVDPVRDLGVGVPQFRSIADVNCLVDGAIIATPNDTHADAAIEAAAHGWGILVEKPIATSEQDAKRIIEAATRADVPLLIGHHRRHHPRVQRARDMLSSGAIGRIVGVQTLWGMRKPDAYFEARWRVGAGGGPILQNLIHEIDLLRFLIGDIKDIQAIASNDARQGPVEDSVSLSLRFASGALGSVLLTDAGLSPWGFEAAIGENPEVARGAPDPWHILGTEGSLGFPDLTLYGRAGQSWSDTLPVKPQPAESVDPFVAQLDHFLDVLAGKASPSVTGEDALATLRATLAVIHATQTSAPEISAVKQ